MSDSTLLKTQQRVLSGNLVTITVWLHCSHLAPRADPRMPAARHAVNTSRHANGKTKAAGLTLEQTIGGSHSESGGSALFYRDQ